MYDDQDYPTMDLAVPRRDNRRWLVVGLVLATVVLLFLAGAVACRGSGDEPVPAAAGTADPTAATPTSSPEQAGAGGSTGDSGGQPDQPGGQPGGDDSGEGPDDDPDNPAPPASPAPRQITVTVDNPPVTPGCTATARVTVTGGEYPVEVSYQWFVNQMLQGVPVLLPLSAEQTTTVDEPGELALTSPDLPSDTSDNEILLRVTDDGQTSDSPLSTYPACHKPGFTI